MKADAPAHKPPASLSEYAIAAIRRDLIEGRLLPGQRIAAEEIARRLQISHIPVREALRFLEAEGHLERDPRKRVRVASISSEQAHDIYGMRDLLETNAYSKGVPALNDHHLAKIDQIRAHMHEAHGRRDDPRFLRADRDFHFVALEVGGSPWGLRFMNNLWDAAARYHSSLWAENRWDDLLEEQHRRLHEAFKRRDAATVIAVMREHRAVALEAFATWASSRDGR